jgi:CHAT domain-containing protein
LPRLWFSRREADAVAALAPRGAIREALDFGASRTKAQKPALADYRVIHFATHAFLDSGIPNYRAWCFRRWIARGIRKMVSCA